MEKHRPPILPIAPIILMMIVLCAGCQTGLDQSSTQPTLEFALIGDTPYGVLPGNKNEAFEQLVAAINANDNIQWIMHAGDIKLSITPCSDEMFQDRLQRFNAFQRPVILTPGDNEWTDCHRITAGQFQPLERLARLRQVFYPNPGTVTIGGGRMQVHTQAADPAFANYPENVWWLQNQVIFGAIHVVGSDNGRAPFSANSSAQRSNADDLEVVERSNAAVAMLQSIFAAAERSAAAGVFIMVHGNPKLEKNLRGSNKRAGFLWFLEALEQHVVAFGKPVVLAHGDSHYFRIDQPPLIENKFLPNFTRVETYGFPNVHHWIRVTVKPNTAAVFSFTQEWVKTPVDH